MVHQLISWLRDQDLQKVFGAAAACVVALIATGRYIRNSSAAAAARRKREHRQEKTRQSIDRIRRRVQGKRINSSICELPFRDLRDQLQNGQLTASEVLLAFEAQALLAHENLNCVTEFIESAQRLAEALDQVPATERGPLHGIPVSLKESIGVKGSDWSTGLAHYLGEVCSEDGILVQVMIKQGAVPFVRTNVSQAMMSIHCRNPIFGETLNPVQPSRTCGGSSGGEAALMGAGASVLGIGCDMGGSNRIPAHFCGIVGIRVTPKRLTNAGNIPVLHGIEALAEVYSPMGRDVESIVTYLRATLGPDLYNIAPDLPQIPWREEIYKSSKPLTIGFYTHDGGLEPVPAVTRAVMLAKDKLEGLGHKVVNCQPLDTPDVIGKFFYGVALGDGNKTLQEITAHDEVEPDVQSLLSLLRTPLFVRKMICKLSNVHPVDKLIMTTEAPPDVYTWWQRNEDTAHYMRKVIQMWKSKGVDAVICPVMPFTAWPIGQEEHCAAGNTFCTLYNILDFPCGVVPTTTVQREDLEAMANYPKRNSAEAYVHKISEGSLGLPVGVQCVSLPFQEEVLMRLMSDLENAL